MDATLLNRPQERDARRQQQTADQERKKDCLIECDVFATSFCFATSLGLLAYGAIYLYYYITEMPTYSLWYSLIFIFLLLGSMVWKFCTRFQIKEFHARQRRESELKHMDQPVPHAGSTGMWIQQHAIELNSNDVQDGSSSNNFYNEANSTCCNRPSSNTMPLNSSELITDMQQAETSNDVAGSPQYPTIYDHGDFVEYVFGPRPAKRTV